jgi:hypothetical protein
MRQSPDDPFPVYCVLRFVVVPIQRPSFDPLIRNEWKTDGVVSRHTITKHSGYQRNAALYESLPMLQLVGEEDVADLRFSKMIGKPKCILGAVCVVDRKNNALAA